MILLQILHIRICDIISYSICRTIRLHILDSSNTSKKVYSYFEYFFSFDQSLSATTSPSALAFTFDVSFRTVGITISQRLFRSEKLQSPFDPILFMLRDPYLSFQGHHQRIRIVSPIPISEIETSLRFSFWYMCHERYFSWIVFITIRSVIFCIKKLSSSSARQLESPSAEYLDDLLYPIFERFSRDKHVDKRRQNPSIWYQNLKESTCIHVQKTRTEISISKTLIVISLIWRIVESDGFGDSSKRIVVIAILTITIT